MRLRVLLPSIVVAALGLLAALTAAGAGAQPSLPGTPVPQGFVGVDLDGPALNPANNVNLAHQFDVMVASGVQTVRVAFDWSAAQPYKSWSDVPPDKISNFIDVNNVPTDFNATDEIVGLAAQRGLTVLPTVLYAPGWDEGANKQGVFGPPARSGPYTDYLTALIDRYGPHGTFWATAPRKLPIRQWQIWNEENLAYYWPQPFAKSYVKLLKAAHKAIKQADPGAKVVLGALTNTAWKFLGQIEKQPGAHRAFDVIAVNGFTSTPANVILYLKFMRRAANRNGDRAKPLLATELSWPSAKGKSPQHFTWNTTEQGQATNISQLLPLLATYRSDLDLIGFDYYTWMGRERRHAPAFDFAGLLRLDSSGKIVAKPALSAYKRGALALEHCRRKGSSATACIR